MLRINRSHAKNFVVCLIKFTSYSKIKIISVVCTLYGLRTEQILTGDDESYPYFAIIREGCCILVTLLSF